VRRAVPLLAAALALAACATERARSVPIVDAAEVSLVVEDDGPWREVAAAEAPSPVAAPVAVATPVERPSPPPAPRTPAPVRRAAPAPRTAATSAADLAREHHLANPTRIRAQRITFRCPPRYAAEVSRSAASAAEESPGRSVLSGGARVLCRELTLEADRIVLEVRRDGVDDLQVIAKGDVSFVTVQRGQVLREEGVRSLLLTNDRLLPLRSVPGTVPTNSAGAKR
jgi:hypothetical protein